MSLDKTVCRLEVLGKLSSMSYNEETDACLVTTILNGAHVFNMDADFYGANLSHGLSTSSVETYPYHVFGNEPILCSSFLGGGRLLALGSSTGTVTVVSRRSRRMAGCYSTHCKQPIRSLCNVPGNPNCMLLCTEGGGEIVDVERSVLVLSLENPVPRAVGSVAFSPTSFAVANYDGKVLLYDTRYRASAAMVLSIPDQITCLSACSETHATCVGTVAGRVFVLRCVDSNTKEQAFGTGKKRAPLRCVSMRRGRISAGDIAGRLSLIDTVDVPDPTVYWTPETLFENGAKEGASCKGEEKGMAYGSKIWSDSEVTGTSVTEGVVWASYSPANVSSSQIVALPL